MKKLLMVTGLGAAEGLAQGKLNALYSTLQEFHKHWERIDIVIPRVKRPVVSELFGNVFLHVSPLPLAFHPAYFLFKVLRLHRAVGFDLMTVHEFPPFYNGIGARILWHLARIPYVLEIMHIPGYPKAGSLKEKVYAALFNAFIRFDAAKARAVRVINQGIFGMLRNRGIPESKLKLISAMYIDTDIFKPMEAEKSYDAVFVGRLEKNKGISVFLDAVREAGLRALVVGDGPLRRSVQDRIRDEHLEAVFHGWAKDSAEVAELMNQSRILIMPSYNEGGPRVVLEAMACGVPVLATPVGIVPEVIGDAGMMIDWDAADIARKAEELLHNRQRYEACRAAGIAIAQRHERVQAITQYAQALQALI